MDNCSILKKLCMHTYWSKWSQYRKGTFKALAWVVLEKGRLVVVSVQGESFSEQGTIPKLCNWLLGSRVPRQEKSIAGRSEFESRWCYSYPWSGAQESQMCLRSQVWLTLVVLTVVLHHHVASDSQSWASASLCMQKREDRAVLRVLHHHLVRKETWSQRKLACLGRSMW